MSNYSILINLAKKNNGYITTKEVTNLGIHREYLKLLSKKGVIEKVERGIYMLVDFFDDEMFSLQHRFNKGIYSHGTALFLFHLTDRTPQKYTMTFPLKYNITNVKKKNVEVYRVVDEYYSLGLTKTNTLNGNVVNVYGIERTLCDILRSHSHVSTEEVTNAFKVYSKMRNKDLFILFETAKKLKVDKKVRAYLEVLLW